MDARRCTATAKSGKPCTAHAWRDGLCLWHHPAAAEQRRANSRKGGQSRSAINRLRRGLPMEELSVQQVQAVLGAVLRDLLEGKLDPSVANSAAGVARAFASLASVGELEERLRKLEERAGLRERGSA